MPTSIATELNDDIIVAEGLEAFKGALAPLSSFSTNYSKEAEKRGAALQIPLIGTLTASGTENDYETSAGSMSVVTVTLDGYAKATVSLTDRQLAESSAADLEKFASQMGHAVAEKIITDVFAKITKTNFPTTLSPESGSSVMDLLALARATMQEKKVPLAQRAYFPSPAAYTALAKDSEVRVASAMHYGGSEYIREGLIPRLLGFDLFESSVMPTSSAAPNGFVVHPSAIAVATRAVLPPARAYEDARKVTDKQTGITLSYRRHYSTAKGTHFLTFECYYGSAVGVKEGLILMPSIPASA